MTDERAPSDHEAVLLRATHQSVLPRWMAILGYVAQAPEFAAELPAQHDQEGCDETGPYCALEHLKAVVHMAARTVQRRLRMRPPTTPRDKSALALLLWRVGRSGEWHVAHRKSALHPPCELLVREAEVGN